jgi:hypothetical protein
MKLPLKEKKSGPIYLCTKFCNTQCLNMLCILYDIVYYFDTSNLEVIVTFI